MSALSQPEHPTLPHSHATEGFPSGICQLLHAFSTDKSKQSITPRQGSLQLEKSSALCILLASQAGVAVGDIDVELPGSLDNGLAGLGGDSVCNLSSKLPVVHQEELELLDVVNDELEKSTRKQVPGPLVAAISDIGHRSLALELSADTVINTFGPPPAGLKAIIPIAVVSVEAIRALLHDIDLLERLHHLS